MMLQISAAPEVAPAVPRFLRVDQAHPRRSEVEEVVRCQYRRVHEARRCHFLEHLLVIETQRHGPRAVVGVQRAAASPMFLESYLDRPVEEVLGQHLEARVSRDRIVEIGTLASRDPRNATLLMVLTVVWLAGYGAECGVFTATRAVRHRLGGVGVPLHELASADPAKLGPLASEWGRYYEQDPRVVAATFGESRALADRLPARWAELGIAVFEDGRAQRALEMRA